MVSSAQYCAMLEEALKPAICSKHRGILTNGVVCIMKILNLIWQQQPSKQYEN
jgi:hypothetical protein